MSPNTSRCHRWTDSLVWHAMTSKGVDSELMLSAIGHQVRDGAHRKPDYTLSHGGS